MAERRCALCGQPFPDTLTQVEIDPCLQRLATPALAEERRRLQKEFEHQLVDERERARRLAEKNLRRDIDAANKRAATAEAKTASQLKRQAAEFGRKVQAERQRARREVESELQGEVSVLMTRRLRRKRTLKERRSKLSSGYGRK